MTADTYARCTDLRQLWDAMARGEAHLVDIRTAEEFAAGHPLGAHHAPLHVHVERGDAQPSASRAAKRALRPTFVNDVTALREALDGWLVLSCRTGARSRQALAVLQACGLDRVGHLVGGWDGQVDAWGRPLAPGWRQSGLPTARGLPAPLAE